MIWPFHLLGNAANVPPNGVYHGSVSRKSDFCLYLTLLSLREEMLMGVALVQQDEFTPGTSTRTTKVDEIV